MAIQYRAKVVFAGQTYLSDWFDNKTDASLKAQYHISNILFELSITGEMSILINSKIEEQDTERLWRMIVQRSCTYIK